MGVNEEAARIQAENAQRSLQEKQRLASQQQKLAQQNQQFQQLARNFAKWAKDNNIPFNYKRGAFRRVKGWVVLNAYETDGQARSSTQRYLVFTEHGEMVRYNVDYRKAEEAVAAIVAASRRPWPYDN